MKKLLLGLGAIASVAAPVAAVVACGSKTPDATNTDAFAEANTKIAAAISDIADTAFAKPIDERTPMWDTVTKESEMNREIKIVNTGFKVTLENTKGTEFDAYFATEAEIQPQLDKAFAAELAYEKNNHPSGPFSKELTIKKQEEISTSMIVYSDSVSNGFKEVYTNADFATQSFLDFDADAFITINTIITDALAPKPVAAPKATSALTATSTLTMAQFKDAITDHSTPANHAEVESALHITLPSSISSDHIYEIDTKDESGKTITLIVKQGTTSMSTDTDVKVATA